MCWSCHIWRRHSVCTPCRRVKSDGHICESCGNEMLTAPGDWAAPRKNDDKAWKEIEKGNWLWDTSRVDRVAKRKRTRTYDWLKIIKEKRREEMKLDNDRVS